MQNENALIWLDLEMTGLDPFNNVIVEISAIITNNNLQIIAEGQSLVINQPEEALCNLDPWVQNQHTKNGLFAAVRSSTISNTEAQDTMLAFVAKYVKPQTGLLCGNSIWQDRFFLRMQMPTLEKYFNYRMIDVSTIKELIHRWYPNHPYAKYEKSDGHRALADIQESINELEHYRKYFFVMT